MARGAIGKRGLVDVIRGDEACSERHLILGRLPVHIEHALDGPEVFLWRAMTVETPLHFERRNAPRERHPVDRPVAGCAAHAFRDVNGMIDGCFAHGTEPMSPERFDPAGARE